MSASQEELLVQILKRLEAIEALLGSRSSEASLTEREQDILEAVAEAKLTGEELAKASGYEYDGHFKNLLSSLVKRNILVNDHPGYRRPQVRSWSGSTDDNRSG